MKRGTLIAVLIGGFSALGLIGAVLNRPSLATSTDTSAGAAATVEGVGDALEVTSENPALKRAEPAMKPESADASISRSRLTEAPPFLDTAGDLLEIDGWLNTEATNYEDFDGQVQIVQFWTYSCYNCTNTLPYLKDIYAEYEADGLEIIGVHAPEFTFERDPANVAAAVEELGVTWPVALDTERLNFRKWQVGRNFWPRTYVVDQNGEIRFDEIGEGRYGELEDTVAWLIENGP